MFIKMNFIIYNIFDIKEDFQWFKNVWTKTVKESWITNKAAACADTAAPSQELAN